MRAGEGDMIAYNLPITKEWKDSLLYCGEDVITHQVIVQQGRGKQKPLKDVTELVGKDIYVKPGEILRPPRQSEQRIRRRHPDS